MAQVGGEISLTAGTARTDFDLFSAPSFSRGGNTAGKAKTTANIAIIPPIQLTSARDPVGALLPQWGQLSAERGIIRPQFLQAA